MIDRLFLQVLSKLGLVHTTPCKLCASSLLLYITSGRNSKRGLGRCHDCANIALLNGAAAVYLVCAEAKLDWRENILSLSAPPSQPLHNLHRALPRLLLYPKRSSRSVKIA